MTDHQTIYKYKLRKLIERASVNLTKRYYTYNEQAT